jgi:glutathione synthase/RimK-type ligase-like ATP-grasp enzyme
MRSQLLILTSEGDLHADAVIKQIADRGRDFGVIRINTDCLSTNLDYCFHWSESGELRSQVLRALDSRATAEDVRVVWYRKPDRPPPHPALTDPVAKKCSADEYREFLRSFAGLFPDAVWVNDYWQMQRWSIKANQIKIARTVGLAVPETLITNRLGEVRALADRHPEIIHKSMDFPGFGWGDDHYACFTNLLTSADLSKLSDIDLQYAPGLYQQRIHKATELRVTVVGSRVFACEIKSQPGTLQGIDWRIDNAVDQLPHLSVDLPLELQKQLTEVLRLMGLNFGAFDLIQDSAGTYYFLEVNPNGQYYWIELMTEMPITAAMVDLIFALASSSGSEAGSAPSSESV